VVLSGSLTALQHAARLCRERGAIRVRTLRVPYAAHCGLMAPAAETMRAALASVPMRPPAVPFYSGVTARATQDPAEIRAVLADALTEPVRFSAVVGTLAESGHREFVELGPGSPPRLLGLIRETFTAAGLDPPSLALVSNDEQAAVPEPFKPPAAPTVPATTVAPG
jgi:[acyl-carrier-protein] S-malonyltransferase